MMIDRDRVLKTLRDAAAEVDLEWPPPPGQPVALDHFLEEYVLSSREFPALTRQIVREDLLSRGVDLQGVQPSSIPLAGFLIATASEGDVYINQSDPITRKRFSAAHELGHFLLHFRGVAGTEESFIKAEEQEQFCDGEPVGMVLDHVEREANLFAAELLMPEEVLRTRISELGKQYQLSETFLRNQLASELLVSRDAVKWRLKNLNLRPSAIGGGA